jgi:hypothetical protein
LTAAPCFWLANHNDWSMWFAISSLPPICSPSFLFYGWGCKKVTKLGCKKYFCRVTYWAPMGML